MAAKKPIVTVPDGLKQEIVDGASEVVTEVDQEAVVLEVNRQVEILDMLRSVLHNLPPGERAVAFSLMQELQESL